MIGQRKKLMKFRVDKSWKLVAVCFCLFLVCALAYILTLDSMDGTYKATPRARLVNRMSLVLNSLFLPCFLILVAFYARSRLLGIAIISICFTAWLGNSMYYEYFESPMQLSMTSRISVLTSISSQIIWQCLSWREVTLLVAWLLALILYILTISLHSSSRDVSSDYLYWKISCCCLFLMCLVVVKGVVFVVRYSPFEPSRAYEMNSLKKNGFLVYFCSQFISSLDAEAPLPSFPGKILANEYPTAESLPRKVWNVIFVQVESLDAQMINLKVGDRFVMPNLQRFKNAMIHCENFFAHHRVGATQDSELSALFSLIPSNQRPGYGSLRFSDVESLCGVLKRHGYSQVGFHSNDGEFFNRKWLMKKTGFDHFADSDCYEGDAKGWNAKDVPFVEQTFPMIKSLKEPFFAYLITMQSHGPFNNYTEASSNLDVNAYSPSIAGYFRSMNEVDQALARFVELLSESSIADRTILFVFGDHCSDLTYETPDYKYRQHPPSEHVTLFIMIPGVSPRVIERVCSQIDLAPSVCSLLGLREGKNWLGSSIFEEEKGKVILNYSTPRVIENVQQSLKFRDADLSEMKFIEWSEVMQNSR
jgi:phosphoglycerol transferase MdoB-like AlkP superfamily enzyme